MGVGDTMENEDLCKKYNLHKKFECTHPEAREFTIDSCEKIGEGNTARVFKVQSEGKLYAVKVYKAMSEIEKMWVAPVNIEWNVMDFYAQGLEEYFVERICYKYDV